MQRTATVFTEKFPVTAKRVNTPHFKIEKRNIDSYELSIQGNFSLGWLARLTTGLSDHQISILRGDGKLIKASYWEATFDIKTGSKTADPRDIDYLSLLETEVSSNRNETLELIDYSIQPSDANNKAVWVEIQGTDKIGFLRSLLKIFSFNSLFPCAIEIGTTGSNASDRFLLRGIAGSPPSRNALQALKEQLDDYIVS